MGHQSDADTLLSEFDGSQLHRPFATRVSEILESTGDEAVRVIPEALEKLRGELGSIVSGIRSEKEGRSILFTMISIVAGYDLAGAKEAASALRGLLEDLSKKMAELPTALQAESPGAKLSRFEGQKASVPKGEPPPEGSTKAGPLARFALQNDEDD